METLSPPAPRARRPAAARRAVWETRGFEAFRAGSFGNGGQNLYVSRRGVLQRIFQYDLTRNGYADLLFCESQDHCESAPALVVEDPLGAARETRLPARGVMGAVAADLTGDGWPDLVLACGYDGINVDQNACVYYGSPDGYSERRMNLLPAPGARAVASGDFDGRGRPAVAFLTRDGARIFYAGRLGVEARRFVDLPIAGRLATAGDLDGDGCAELAVRDEHGCTTVFWGGPDGIDPKRFTRLSARGLSLEEIRALKKEQSESEDVDEPDPLPQIVTLAGRPAITVVTADDIRFFSAGPDRVFEETLRLACPRAQAVAVGRLAGGAWDDLAVAARRFRDGKEFSRIYWGGPDGWSGDRADDVPTCRACDIAIGDVNGDGRAELVVCQAHTDFDFTTESLVFPACAPGRIPAPARFATDDARRTLLLDTPDGRTSVCFVNRFSRSSVGKRSVRVYTGAADGYRPDRFLEMPAHCAVEGLYADIDDDGRPELVVVNCAENSVWLDPGSFVHRIGPGGFDPARTQVLPTRGAHGAVCADFDRDGYLDLIFSSFHDPWLTLFRGGPDGFDTEHPVKIPLAFEGETRNFSPRWIYAVDLNNNGWLDLVAPLIHFDRSLILWGGPDGFSVDRRQELAVHRGCCARAADFTGNGYPDLVVGGHSPTPRGGVMPPDEWPRQSFAYVYWNGPEGISEANRTLLRADAVNGMAIADFNGDGRLDLFVGSYTNGRERDIDSFLYWNREGRYFANDDVTRLRTHSASGCIATDLNGDGLPDLVVANHKVHGDHRGFSTIWWNGPGGFDRARTLDLPTEGPHGITSVEPGNLLTRGPEEYYTSAAYRLPLDAEQAVFSWEGEIPPSTAVRGRLRWARTEAELARAAWGVWRAAGRPAPFAAPRGACAQYQLELRAEGCLRSPRLVAVIVTLEGR